MANLNDLLEFYRRDLLGSVIPFWLRHSLDRRAGGYFNCLDRDGAVYDPRKYVWMQGREAWMFARLCNSLGPQDEWMDAARLGIDFLRKHAFDDQGRVWFALRSGGAPAAFQRKPYAAVFVMLAYLEFGKATGNEELRDQAFALFHSIQRWIADPGLLGRTAPSGAPKYRQLADTMVTLSMALELADAVPSPEWDAVIDRSITAALDHVDPRRNILLENVPVTDHGGANVDLRQYPEGRLFCPGHSAEVCWFLLHALERRPDESRRRAVLDILDASLNFGWDEEFGGLSYFVDIQGRPPAQLEAGMKLWWPHTEALYATLLAQITTGEARWSEWHGRIREYSYRVFADPVHGEWFGYCDRMGKPTHTLKGGAYKGCFHVPRALLLCIEAIERKLGMRPAPGQTGPCSKPV